MQSFILLSYYSHIGANILSAHKCDATCFEIIRLQAKIPNLEARNNEIMKYYQSCTFL